MMKKVLAAVAFSAVAMSAQAGALLTEGFDDVGSLTTNGWVIVNASTPGGITEAWGQGDQQVFRAQQGARESYAVSRYNSAGTGGFVNNWLITPEFSTAQGATVSLWARADAFPGTSDQLAFGVSSGSSATSAFTLAPAFTVPTGAWTRYVYTIGKSEGMARFAINYAGTYDLSNYVGVDSLRISEVPEPTTMAILFAGVMGLTMSRRRKRG